MLISGELRVNMCARYLKKFLFNLFDTASLLVSPPLNFHSIGIDFAAGIFSSPTVAKCSLVRQAIGLAKKFELLNKSISIA